MSTRGSVAWREKDGNWKGVYNHSASYPTCLGAEVWQRLKELGADAVVRRLKSVGDWREFDGGGVCEYCGKVAGQPHSIRGDIYMAAMKPEARRSGFPDPQAKYHAHGDGKADQFDPRPDALFMEWVYLIEPERGVVEVWHMLKANRRTPDMTTTGVVGEAGYTHAKAGEFPLNEPEPDWQAVENIRSARR